MENFFGLLKSELLYLEKFASYEDFIRKLKDYIIYYNTKRIKLKIITTRRTGGLLWPYKGLSLVVAL